jgi:hypothetical protein
MIGGGAGGRAAVPATYNPETSSEMSTGQMLISVNDE